MKKNSTTLTENITNEIKDNPVPSLDKYNIKLFESISYIEKHEDDSGPKGYVIVLKSGTKLRAYYNCWDGSDIKDSKENLDKLILELQNGVETNKEQPSKTKCIVCEEKFTSICSDKCGNILL